MLLKDCATVWGGSVVLAHDPELHTVEDSLYVPFTEHVFFDRDPAWGVYQADRTLFDPAAYRRGPERALVGQSQVTTLDPSSVDERAPEHTYIYGGPIIPHFGHFLLSTLSRLWGMPAGMLGNHPILCHADHDPVAWFQHSYIDTIFRALGLSPDSFVRFTRPTRVGRLIVAQPAFGEQAFAHPAFARLCHAIGAKAAYGPAVSGWPAGLSGQDAAPCRGRACRERG